MSRVGQPQRERRDVDPRAVVLSGAALAALVAFTLLFVGLIFGIPPKPLPFGSAMQQLLRQAQPVLQTDSASDLQAYKAEKDRVLHSYGWIDRNSGIAHVPIDKAMDIIARSGVPEWGQHSQPPKGDCALYAANVPRAPQAVACRAPTAGAKP